MAAALSLVIPGAGQMYKGQIVNGLVWLLLVVTGYVVTSFIAAAGAIFTFGLSSFALLPAIILHLCCIFGAAMGDPTKAPRSALSGVATIVVFFGVLSAIGLLKFADTREREYIASMKDDLRNLLTAEEAYFSDSVKYTASPPARLWQPSAGFRLRNSVGLTGDDPRSYGWYATEEPIDGRTTVVCSIYVGVNPGGLPGLPAYEGAPRCARINEATSIPTGGGRTVPPNRQQKWVDPATGVSLVRESMPDGSESWLTPILGDRAGTFRIYLAYMPLIHVTGERHVWAVFVYPKGDSAFSLHARAGRMIDSMPLHFEASVFAGYEVTEDFVRALSTASSWKFQHRLEDGNNLRLESAETTGPATLQLEARALLGLRRQLE